jgi:hypothetical protein
MWVVNYTAPPPLCLGTSPPLARLVAHPPPPTHMEEVSSDDSLLLDSSCYNDECPHIKEVSFIYMNWF